MKQIVSKEKKITATAGMLALLFTTFGITYLDFADLSFTHNLRPWFSIAIGLISGAYLFYLRWTEKRRKER